MSLTADPFTFSFFLFYPLSLLAAVLAGDALRRFGFPVPKGPRFGNIDGLPGFLALWVLSHHFWIWTHAVVFGSPSRRRTWRSSSSSARAQWRFSS